MMARTRIGNARLEGRLGVPYRAAATARSAISGPNRQIQAANPVQPGLPRNASGVASASESLAK